jgi:hypothetical protein
VYFTALNLSQFLLLSDGSDQSFGLGAWERLIRQKASQRSRTSCHMSAAFRLGSSRVKSHLSLRRCLAAIVSVDTDSTLYYHSHELHSVAAAACSHTFSWTRRQTSWICLLGRFVCLCSLCYAVQFLGIVPYRITSSCFLTSRSYIGHIKESITQQVVYYCTGRLFHCATKEHNLTLPRLLCRACGDDWNKLTRQTSRKEVANDSCQIK